VVGGRSCVSHPGLVAIAQRTLQDFATSAGMPPPVVRPASYGLLAAAVGAAAMVLHQYMRPIQTRAAAQGLFTPQALAPQSVKKLRQPALA
jgi:hypothetical protein